MRRSLSRLARSLAHEDTAGLLKDFANAANSACGTSGAAVLVARAGTLASAGSGYAPLLRALTVELAGYPGPARDTYASQRVVAVSDISDRRGTWPAFTAAALSSGVIALVCLPWAAQQESGVVVLCDRRLREWDQETLARARILTDIVGTYLGLLEDLHGAASRKAALRHALESRVKVEQAKGILASQHDVSMESALKLLRHHARNRGLVLQDVAAEVISGRLRL